MIPTSLVILAPAWCGPAMSGGKKRPRVEGFATELDHRGNVTIAFRNGSANELEIWEILKP